MRWNSSMARTCSAIEARAALPTDFGSLSRRGFPFMDGPALRQIAIDRIVRGGLICHCIGPHAAPHQFGKHVGGITEQADRNWLPVATGLSDDRQRFVEIPSLAIEIAGSHSHLDA